jgi:peptidyl-prolyl cis-trans isomerase SurA
MRIKNSLLYALLVSLFSLPMHSFSKEVLVEGIAAVVNGRPILLSEFEQAWKIRLEGLKGKVSNEEILRKNLINRMVMLKLQEESAENNGIRVNERELNASIDLIARNNKLSLKEFYLQVEKQGLSISSFRENIRQQVIAQRLQNQLFGNRVRITKTEIDEVLKREKQINDPFEYQIKNLLVRPEKNIQQSWDQAHKKILQIRASVIEGQSFNEALALYSNSNEAFNDVNLPWLDASSMPDAFHKAVAKLEKLQLSEPIKTGRGYFLLQLVNKQYKQKVQSFRYRLERILLALGSYDELAAIKAEQEIHAHLQNKPNSFAELAKIFSKDNYANSGGKTDWLKVGEIQPLLAAQLNAQSVSKTLHKVLLPQGWLLYRIVDKESYDASEESIRQNVRQRLTYLKVQEEYEDFLRNLRARSAVQINI